MMRIFVCAFLLFNSVCVAQTDSVNRLVNGKKDGYWKVFLDSQLRITDSASSFFYAYNLYDTGNVVFDYGERARPYTGEVMTYSDTFPQKGHPVVLTGTFSWKNVNGRTSNLEIYANGKPVFWQSVSYSKNYPDDPYKETIYFDRLYNNIPGTFYYTESSNHDFREYWFYEGEKGKWYAHKIK